MTALLFPEAATGSPQAALAAEWERAEALALLAQDARRDRAPQEAALESLRAAQTQVDAARASGAWSALPVEGLSPLELDVLALALAPEASPRIGWTYQALHGRQGEPFPTLHLVQEVLGLSAAEAPELLAAIAPGAPLRARGLLRVEGEGPFAVLAPAPRAAGRATGRPPAATPPPAAVPIPAAEGWDDLVLPPGPLATLRAFLAHVVHRRHLTEAWGARPSGGPIALFAGPSGAGKTFAASVVAGALGWPLYRVDLGRLVSKYIGETEKNLNAVFDAAHDADMVLQFDEADSLFARRGEVKEARDRYANMEVSHLLARVESHSGPVILTTNLRDQIDAAFARRFTVVVDFPKPDAAARAELWRRALPPRAPRAADLDLDLLARSAPLCGGHIRNAALHAAVLAADEDAPVALRHAALAVWREFAKEGRPVALSEIGPLAAHLRRRPE